MTFGLRALARQHRDERLGEEEPVGQLLTGEYTAAMLAELADDLDFSGGAYRNSIARLCGYTRLKQQHVIRWRGDGTRLQPAYYIALDPPTKSVIWGIRGTRVFSDFLTSLAASAHPVGETGHHTHFGVLHAAQWLLQKEGAAVADLLRDRPDYKLKLIGHSMGGGVAALMAHLVHTRSPLGSVLPEQRVRAVTFGCPGVLSRFAAGACQPYVTSVILGHDLVPRINASSLLRLRREVAEQDWLGELRREASESRAVQGISSTYESLPSLPSMPHLQLPPLEAPTLVTDAYKNLQNTGAYKQLARRLEDSMEGLQHSVLARWQQGLADTLAQVTDSARRTALLASAEASLEATARRLSCASSLPSRIRDLLTGRLVATRSHLHDLSLQERASDGSGSSGPSGSSTSVSRGGLGSGSNSAASSGGRSTCMGGESVMTGISAVNNTAPAASTLHACPSQSSQKDGVAAHMPISNNTEIAPPNLHPPGRLLFLHREFKRPPAPSFRDGFEPDADPDSKTQGPGQELAVSPPVADEKVQVGQLARAVVLEVSPAAHPQHIVLSQRMMDDHQIRTYRVALAQVASALAHQ